MAALLWLILKNIDPSGSTSICYNTRLELTFSIHKVCQFMHNPLEDSWKYCVERILRYLSATVTHELFLQPTLTLSIQAYYNADWGFHLEDRRSISGYCVFLSSNLVSWGSKKHDTMARSTTTTRKTAINDGQICR